MSQILAISKVNNNKYEEYWEAHYLLVRVLRKLGVVLTSKGRLPLFQLWIKISHRMTGVRRSFILTIIQSLVQLRINGKEPPHKGNMYL